jgi:hypothetical protein
MTRRLSSRRILWLTYMLPHQSSIVRSCSLSRLHQAATTFERNTLLLSYRYCAASHPHSPPFSTALAYFGLLHELEHVHYSIACNQDFEVSSVWRFADCNVFGFQLLHHGLPFPAPLSTFEQEMCNGLSAAAAPPAACVFGLSDLY